MAETLEKLRPDRDLQCYFFRPSAIAALSDTSATGFTVSGAWRQQFDWAVIEWNRDNVFEHPAFRYLPDGDLSGLTLTYDETRQNCIPLDSDLFPTVDWPSLRVWTGTSATPVYVPLKDHATAIEGTYQCAYADFTLSGSLTAGTYAGLGFFTEHHTYQVLGGDTLESVAQAITDSVNAFSALLKATRTGATIRLFYTGGGGVASSTAGANGNRFGAYSYSTGTQTWDAAAKTLAGGTSPTKWRVSLNFGALLGSGAQNIRKMRWTYAADLQAGAYARSEFAAVVSNWTVTGTGRAYLVAGRESRRMEDPEAAYSGAWEALRGNYSGGTIRRTTAVGASATCQYSATAPHSLFVGLRYTANAAIAAFTLDGQAAGSVDLGIAGEDVLMRWPLGTVSAGTHTVAVTHAGTAGEELFFDFVELAIAAPTVTALAGEPGMTLATDWDTDHSIAVAPERTAWMIDSLGFRGRQNHYVGALWFYELTRKDQVYASGSVTFSGTADANFTVTVTIGKDGSETVLQKLIHAGLTAELLATAYALELNRGYTGVRAQASGATVTIYSRLMGTEGNEFTLAASTTSTNLNVSVSGANFTGGVDGTWVTDLTATPRVNRAARDWSRSFFAALAGRGIGASAAFSMELQHGDTSAAAGIAQRGPGGDAIVLPTPALQTNFSPASLGFWKEAHKDMAEAMSAAGVTPYLQFGEVQWWYFPHDGLGTNFSGMPFYDSYTTTEFQNQYGRPLPVFTTNTADPSQYPDEVGFLSGLIGSFTNAIMAHVRATYAAAKFEALYPTDVNQTAFNQAFNYPQGAWTAAALECLKTENFGFTFGKDLNKAEATVVEGGPVAFPASQRAHLVGIGDATAAWRKEARMAQGRKFESVVLFALDQFCLIGFRAPLEESFRRSVRVGGG